MKKNVKNKGPVAVCQLRSGQGHPFSALGSYSALGGGEARIYRQLREAVPVLDAAISKLVRLSGGLRVKCRSQEAQKRLEEFLRTVPCGYGQTGFDSFLSCYMDSLLTYGQAVGELVVAGDRVRGLCWGDVTQLQVLQGSSPMDLELWGPDTYGHMKPLPYQHLLLFTSLNPEPAHPYGVSIFRGLPFLADILMKIYAAIGSNWERAGNVRYSIICKGPESMDPASAQEQGKLIAQEWAKAMEDSKNGTVRDFVAMGDVEIKVIGSDSPILEAQTPVRLMLEQLVAKTGLPPFLLGLNWSTTERMSTQQADILTSELWALRRTVEPTVQKVCRSFLAYEGLDDKVEIIWNDISLQDITQEAQADMYRAQAERYRRT